MRIFQKSKRCFNVKSSTYYFGIKTKIVTDFQICIEVPLRIIVSNFPTHPLQRSKYLVGLRGTDEDSASKKNVTCVFYHFKRQPHKMVKHTQTIHWQEARSCLSVFDHFVGLALKALLASDAVEASISDQWLNFLGTVVIPNWIGGVKNIYYCNIQKEKRIQIYQSMY